MYRRFNEPKAISEHEHHVTVDMAVTAFGHFNASNKQYFMIQLIVFSEY